MHIYRDEISDTAEYSQGTTGPSQFPTSDYQTASFSNTSYSTNFPFSFGQTQCCSRLCSPKQTTLTSVWILHILPVDHYIPINNMIQFHLKWWTDTNHFTSGMSIHPPESSMFLFKDTSQFGW